MNSTGTHELDSEAPHSISCMEIWGGNTPTKKSLSIPGFDIWVGSIPHAEESQGGDIYYLSSCGAGNVSRLSLADVAGHGEASAYIAKRLRHLMRRYINTVDQVDFAQSLNGDFSQFSDRGMYATALLSAYHTETDHMIICNAGHPEPLLYRAASDCWEFVEQDTTDSIDDVYNLPLGIIPGTDYQQIGLKLWPGDTLILYTDAVLEARNSCDQPLDKAGLLNLTQNMPKDEARSLGEALTHRLVHDYHIQDDLTLIILSHNATDPSPPSLKEKLQGLTRMAGLS